MLGHCRIEEPLEWGAGVLSGRVTVVRGSTLSRKSKNLTYAAQESSSHDVATTDDYVRHRILHGVPEGSLDITPNHGFPMDSNLDIMGACQSPLSLTRHTQLTHFAIVDFRKGCYVGQELTVRTYHTGIVRKRAFPVVLEGNKQTYVPDQSSRPHYTGLTTHVVCHPVQTYGFVQIEPLQTGHRQSGPGEQENF